MKLVRLSHQLWFALVLLLGGEALAAGPLMVVVEPSNASLAPDDVRAAVRKLRAETKVQTHWMLSCGGGMPPNVSTKNIRAFLAAARE